MDDKFKKNLAIFLAVVTVMLLLLISLNSCNFEEVDIQDIPIEITVLTTRTGNMGAIEEAQVNVSPILDRFAYVKYDIIGRNDGFEGDIIFEAYFSDTIDLKYNKNIVGDRTFIKRYDIPSGVYKLQIQNAEATLLEYKYK